jgi:hypothetical protein
MWTKNRVLGQVICTMKSASPSISFRVARQLWSLTPASIRGAIPRPGLRKYLNQTIHGPFREAQRFRNLKFQQRDQGRAPRAEIITLSGCQWWPGRDSGRGPSRLRITPAALHLPVLGTRLIGAIGKMDIEGLYAQNVRARPVPGGPAPHPKMRASPPPS